MSGVEFDADQAALIQKMQAVANNGSAGSSSKFAKWLMDKGIVKTDAGAKMILLGIVMINIALTVLIIIVFL